MTEVRLSDQLPGKTKLWRYLSLDKLIDLLSEKKLHFTPLSSFVKTDPYEGFLPKVAMDANAEMYRLMVKDVESGFALVEDHCKRVKQELTNDEQADHQRRLSSLKENPTRYLLSTIRLTAVNCWHASDDESEAMWRMYADKGVAIETTVGALKESIQSCDSKHLVHIYKIKYMDFFDESLKPSDCMVEGLHQAPLLKRRSYVHENEVRAFIERAPKYLHESGTIECPEPSPVRLPVEVKRLVQRVHTSPYAADPFQCSVIKVCELLGLRQGIVEPSKLLLGQEELLKPFRF
jgi:hypothetical protein